MKFLKLPTSEVLVKSSNNMLHSFKQDHEVDWPNHCRRWRPCQPVSG